MYCTTMKTPITLVKRCLSRLSAVQRRDLARTIQLKQYESPEAEAWKMCYSQMKCKISNQLFRIHFNHQTFNGLDMMALIEANRSLFTKDVAQFRLVGENISEEDPCVVERTNSWDSAAAHFNGPKNVKPKDVARDMYELTTCGNRFYMPIDMSHYFNDPCTLNYTFDGTKSFDENWEEIRRVKKNENDYILQNDRWKSLVDTEFSWLSIVPLSVSNAEIRSPTYYSDPRFQGLGVVVSSEASYWSFCFRVDPSLIDVFVKKYDLQKVSE